MALATLLPLVGAAELDQPRARPPWLHSPRPRPRPLTGMLFGCSSVRCPTLEHGRFDVVAPHQVRRVLGALDVAAVRRRVERAAPEALEADEVDDHELLLEEDGDPAGVIEAERTSLVDSYKQAARGRHAIASYMT